MGTLSFKVEAVDAKNDSERLLESFLSGVEYSEFSQQLIELPAASSESVSLGSLGGITSLLLYTTAEVIVTLDGTMTLPLRDLFVLSDSSLSSIDLQNQGSEDATVLFIASN